MGFISHYSIRSETVCIDTIGRRLELDSGRVLRFLPTPYAHTAGSFMTLDEKTGILFTSDLFGSVSDPEAWELFMELAPECTHCPEEIPDYPNEHCPSISARCPWSGMYRFHRMMMPCHKALLYAMEQVREADPTMIAPQHGSVLFRYEDLKPAINRLAALDDVGIDGILTGT